MKANIKESPHEKYLHSKFFPSMESKGILYYFFFFKYGPKDREIQIQCTF